MYMEKVVVKGHH